MSFASSLRSTVQAQQQKKEEEIIKRDELAKTWESFKDQVLDKAIDVLKVKCLEEAAQEKNDTVLSFDMITRDVEEFPKRVRSGQTYMVESWGGSTAEAWHFATRGTAKAFGEGDELVRCSQLLDSMVGSFLEKLKPLGFSSCVREPGTWKIKLLWGEVLKVEDLENEFMASMREKFNEAKKETKRRQELGNKWLALEERIFDEAIELMKEECLQKADAGKRAASASFDKLTQDLEAFPKREKTGTTYLVGTWGESTTEEWHYATKGTIKVFTDLPVMYPDLLESIIGRFVTKVATLDFKTCTRTAGTWKVAVTWEASAEDAETTGPLNFMGGLRSRTVAADKVFNQREALGYKWRAFEERILEKTLDVFKEKALAEADAQKKEATISFDSISKDLEGFPKRVKSGDTYLVDSWGESSGEEWHYAIRGTDAEYAAASSSAAVTFPEVLEGMMIRFIEKLSELGFSSCARVPKTWRVAVKWGEIDSKQEVGQLYFGFAAVLRRRKENAIKEAEKCRRMFLAKNWKTFEDGILDKAVEKFKNHCMQEAESEKKSTTISFDFITRDVPGFPKHVKSGKAYIVNEWGDCTAEEWHYAVRGLKKAWQSGPVPSGELLGTMIDRFVEKLSLLDFTTCNRVPGTWKVSVTWGATINLGAQVGDAKQNGKRLAPDAAVIVDALSAPKKSKKSKSVFELEAS